MSATPITAARLPGPSWPGGVAALPPARPDEAAAAASDTRLAFALFIVVNAVLFIRPGEILPPLEGLPIYEALIAACLVAALPAMLDRLFELGRAVDAISACMLGLLITIVLSHLAFGRFSAAFESGGMFTKVVLYYLLLITLVDSPRRLRQLIFWIGGFIIILAALPLLPLGTAPIADRATDPQTGRVVTITRLVGAGIFNDPNDLCQILSVGVIICLYAVATAPKRPLAAAAWLAPLPLLGWAIMQTQSRGGLLALLGGLAALSIARLGWIRTVILVAVTLPLLLAVAGRQGEISTSTQTGQARVQLWSDALVTLRSNPIFGVGQGVFGGAADERVVHNGFLQCYADLGLAGGTFFVAAFYLAIAGVARETRALPRRRPAALPQPAAHDRMIAQLQPFLLAMVVAYAVGLMSLSRSYLVPTALMLALAGAALRLAGRAEALLPAMAMRLIAVSVLFLLVTYAFVRSTVQW